MNMTGNSILITGGTSGIGFELARQLCQNNTVIITGRDRGKLELSKAKLSTAHVMQSDVSDPDAITALYEKVTQEFPALNIPEARQSRAAAIRNRDLRTRAERSWEGMTHVVQYECSTSV